MRIEKDKKTREMSCSPGFFVQFLIVDIKPFPQNAPDQYLALHST